VVLRLYRRTTLPTLSSEAPSEQRHGDIAAKDDGPTRERANQLWGAEGQPEGRQDEYWYRAQELMDDESQISYPPSQSRGNRT
jgi:hypothetical protein